MNTNHANHLNKVVQAPQLRPLAIAVGCLFASTSIYAGPVTAPVVVNPGEHQVWDSSYSVDIDQKNGITVNGGTLIMNGVDSKISNTPNGGYGMAAQNGGTLTLNGGRYDHQTDDSVSAGLSAASGGTVNVVGTTLSTTGQGYLLMAAGAGSSLNIEGSDISTRSGDVLHASKGASVSMKDSTIKIGSDSPLRLPTYSIEVGRGAQFVGEGLTITSDLKGPSGTTLFLSSGSYDGQASHLTLNNSTVSSTEGQKLLDVTAGAGLDGRNLVLNYHNQNDNQNTVAIGADFGGLLNLTDTELNVSGDAAAVALFVTDGGIVNGERLVINAAGKTQGIQLQHPDSHVVLKDSLVATQNGQAIRFAYGEADAPNRVDLIDTELHAANAWAVDTLNSHAELT
nr:hypothetical protein [Neisseriaceae bacterium]